MLNILEAEQRVYKLMGQSTQQLQRMAEEKVGFLMAIQHEITRQLDELEWGEGFLAYLRSVLPPPDFLMLWLRHCRMRNEFAKAARNLTDENLSKDALPDLKLYGRVDILTESSFMHESENHSST
eukprot:GHVU01057512.1.p1 GENE.GHVU01057512.1~~GHVU01057512.1.p1  ORF type:complete len:125 (-),score=26.83 GHVU01057512.1:24-398(-)